MKLILLFISLLCCFPSSAQVFRLRAFSCHIALFNDNSDEISNPDLWGECKQLVVINMDKLKIQVYGEIETDIDLATRADPQQDSVKYIFGFTGVDQSGEKCNVKVLVFKSDGLKQIATLIILYPSMKSASIYKLKRDNQ